MAVSRWAWAGGISILSLLLQIPSTQSVGAATPSFASAMRVAAESREVPIALVEATAYVNTSWEWVGTPALNGGIGPMNIRPGQVREAAQLSGHSVAQIDTDLTANLDAGAALLAHYHAKGTDLTSWQPALVSVLGPFVAAEIFDVLRAGAARTTSTGEIITLQPQALPSISPSPIKGAPSTSTGVGTSGTAPATASTDYPGAAWVPASSSNYTVANRPHDLPVDMIIIHDIEGSYGSAIQFFQTAGFAASAHYVVSYRGLITQMVVEKDIAWHAGNWDYNTRAIGIEHEGFAYTPGLYTTAEYNASAALAASICSRWGVPMDRAHVIGHYQVPDPNHPGLVGGVDHHTDPGPYWNWTYYMARAQTVAATLPSPPHMMPDPVAVSGVTSATVTWGAARTCRPASAPITAYTVVGQPGNLTMNLPATATSATFSGLQMGTSYTFTVTATNSYGQDSAASGPVIPGSCGDAGLTASPASPQLTGTAVRFTATSGVCPNPQYQFWILPPGGVWTVDQPYSASATFDWSTTGAAFGTYSFAVWARDASSPGAFGSSVSGTYDARASAQYTLTTPPCTAMSGSAAPSSAAMIGTHATISGSASGCSNPLYEFWILPPGGTWKVAQPYSPSSTFSWNTTGQATGSYRFSVWVRNAGSLGLGGTAPNTYDAFSAFEYALTRGCPSATASSTPPSTATVGTTVTITGTAAGCASPLYEFWILPPGGIWKVGHAFSTSSTFIWNTAGKPAGSYRFSVWARDATSRGTFGAAPNTYDAFSAFQYMLTTSPCTAMTSSSAPPSTTTVGTTGTIAGSTSGCPNPLYEFWILPPGGTWRLAQPYSASSTLTWVTSGQPAGSYRFSVWARDASSPGTGGKSPNTYDTFSAFQYDLS